MQGIVHSSPVETNSDGDEDPTGLKQRISSRSDGESSRLSARSLLSLHVMIMLASAAQPTFSAWENFYVIVGSSAGALTGLQFVVITLIAEGRATGGMHEVRAFGTPTVVHFCVALLISAIVSCPWQSVSRPALAVAACGVGGMLYIFNALRHARQATGYKPDIGDWIWYSWLPLLIYLLLFGAGLLLNHRFEFASFSIAAISLALLFLGIRNAWDTVTFIAVQQPGKQESSESSPSQP